MSQTINGLDKPIVQVPTLKTRKGGARPNSGRKKTERVKEVMELKERLKKHALMVVSAVVDGEVIKSTRGELLLQKLWNMGMQGNVTATREYYDRSMGKAEQPIRGTGEDEAILIKIDV